MITRTLPSPVYWRYGLASLVALGCDMSAFLLALRIGMAPVPASAISYAIGILVHWLISSRLVFAAGAAPRGPGRTRQKGLFVGSALVGLAITIGIMSIATWLGETPILGKFAAIVVSFQVTYLLRRSIVFTT